jgi:hypothetical protein
MDIRIDRNISSSMLQMRRTPPSSSFGVKYAGEKSCVPLLCSDSRPIDEALDEGYVALGLGMDGGHRSMALVSPNEWARVRANSFELEIQPRPIEGFKICQCQPKLMFGV